MRAANVQIFRGVRGHASLVKFVKTWIARLVLHFERFHGGKGE